MPLNGAGLDALLVALDADREQAARRFEAMRQRLRSFFAWRGAPWPDELADETMDRVGRRLAEGEIIRSGDVGRYAAGVARNVLRECWHREHRRPLDGRAGSPAAADEGIESEEALRLGCLERCLAALPSADRELLLLYYANEGTARIEARRALAGRLGLAAGALRIRVHRLRVRLEACVRTCVRQRATSSAAGPHTDEDGN